MKLFLCRALMALAARCMGDSRRQWSMAMEAEFDEAVAQGDQLQFSAGCLMAAWRTMLAFEEGRFILTSYAMVLILILPMAALQIGCALFGLPYLFPGGNGLVGALLEGAAHENLLRTVYQGAILPLALVQLLICLGHVQLAWAVLERDWGRATRSGMRTLASAATLVLFLGVFFLNSSQALLQGAILCIELGIVSLLAQWHMQIIPVNDG